jgi:hypothetical protein
MGIELYHDVVTFADQIQLYPTEINSMAMRTKGAALGTATNWCVCHRELPRNLLTK